MNLQPKDYKETTLKFYVCITNFCIPLCNIVQRWILSRTFKDDINLDYGIYSEDGDIVVAEDRNAEYEGTQERQENVYDVLFQ